MRSALEQSRRFVLPELTGRACRSRPDHPAVIDGDETRTHAQLHDRAGRLASVLAARGVRAGDCVALLLHNRIEFVEALLACHRRGAVAVPINFRLALDEIEYILADSGAAALISDTDVPAYVGVVVEVGPDYEDAVASAVPWGEAAEVFEDDVALMCYTSGTTGRPKGALLTHRSLVASTLSWIHEMRAGQDDVWLSGQPLFHIGGINGLLPFLVLGATVIITPSTTFDPEAMLALISAHGVTMCIFVPTQWAVICASRSVTRVDPEQLRVAMWGASPAPLHTLEEMARAFPRAAIVSAYGQTEMSGATTLLKGADSTRKMGSVGKPMLGVELRVVDDELRDVPVGSVGEIAYRGPNVMAGYHEQPDATAEAFAGDWFHSGDLARLDEEGYLWLVDRKKDLIVSGGENVYPAEVERVLLDHPGVADAAVIGVPHPRWVETPVAFVVPSGAGAVSEDELITHCREYLAGYKKPSAIVIVGELPRNAGGKVLKRQLRETYSEGVSECHTSTRTSR
ncbi:MAG: long-chain fatty acid--CoA ligase [Solirubrobacterales bacterium]|nr:long-chain fatty acid--CoA ligase [Solirubrobacterales bacterium]